MKRAVLFFTLLSILYLNCVSMSTYQTAQVLEKKQSQFGAAAYTMSNYKLEIFDEDDELQSETVTGGTIEAFYRAPVCKNLDVGIKAYLVGTVIDGKYQFVNHDNFDMAVDLGIGYQQMSISDDDYTIFDIYPTLLLTFNLSTDVDVTLAPKIISRYVSGPTATSTFMGGTIMLRFGPVMPEFGYYVIDGQKITTFGVGIAKTK